jgi:uncharacterized membrane protein HdeD (DUF308 family)
MKQKKIDLLILENKLGWGLVSIFQGIILVFLSLFLFMIKNQAFVIVLMFAGWLFFEGFFSVIKEMVKIIKKWGNKKNERQNRKS